MYQRINTLILNIEQIKRGERGRALKNRSLPHADEFGCFEFAVVFFDFAGGKIDFAGFDGINCVIIALARIQPGLNFGPALAHQNSPGID